MTSKPANLLTEWAEAWSSHEAGRVLGLFTEDCVYEDVTFGVVARGSMEWIMSGTHAGDFPGMPATGKRFAGIRGATVCEFGDARIRRCSDYWDAATFMKQVSLLG